MSRSNIGGPLGMAELALLHQPPHQQALADARNHLRRCLAALRACDLPRAGDAAAVLADQLIAIEQLQARA